MLDLILGLIADIIDVIADLWINRGVEKFRKKE